MRDFDLIDLDSINTRSSGRSNMFSLDVFNESGDPRDFFNGTEAKKKASANTAISDSVYNDAMNRLKRSFKEGIEVIEMMNQARATKSTKGYYEQDSILDIELDDMNSNYNESLDDIRLDNFFFELGDSVEKRNIREIISFTRSAVANFMKDQNVSFYKPSVISSFFKLKDVANQYKFWNNYSWQVAGVIHANHRTVSRLIDDLNYEIEDKLDKYKVIPVRITGSLYDDLKTKFEWGDNLWTYLLIVSDTVPDKLRQTLKKY